MTQHGRIETHYPASDAIRKLDETQGALREGPCIAAIDDPPPSGILVAQNFAGADMKLTEVARWLTSEAGKRSARPGAGQDERS